MKHFVITIGREYGSGGCEIARRLSKLLNVEYYDKYFVDGVAIKKGVTSSAIALLDENIEKKTIKDFDTHGLDGTPPKVSAKEVFAIQKSYIKELAEKESCIIVGRCGDYVLRDRDDVFNLFIYSPYEYRIRHIIERENCTAQEASEKIARINRRRHNFYKYVTGSVRGDRQLRNMLIDSSFLGIEETANLIADIVKKKFSD